MRKLTLAQLLLLSAVQTQFSAQPAVEFNQGNLASIF